ncbi:hypothetical protein BH23ACT4_BH23ACT4_12000 [soil metagenome]
MTLSGNLGFVPLDEVLRLLARAGNAGVVEITNRETSGRIFVTGAGIGLATTFDDQDLKAHLESSGYLSSADAGPFDDALVGLVREMTVESIYRMDGENADFQVVKDTTSPYASPEPFDLERILDDSRKRAEQWESVTRRVPDLEATMKINRTLAAETVELDRASWRLLSEIGSGASVKDLAAKLGTTRYAVASVVATMVDTELLVFEDGAAEIAPEVAPVYDVPVAPVAQQAETHGDETEIDPDRSWWDEPEADQPASVDDTELQPVTADTDEVSADAADTEDDAEDTDAFLKKVFSEVTGEPAEEDGHGLMRRRRMGSILRELGEE